MPPMLAIPLNPAAWLNELAVGLVEIYQRRLSPLKGFRCAHRVLRGGRSCSEHAKQVVRRWGVWKLWPLLKRRFARCAEAKQVLDYGGKRKPAEQEQARSTDGGCASSFGHGMSCDPGISSCDVPVPVEGCDVGAGACDGVGACDCGGGF
jgi:uncharacterized protein